MGRPKAKRRVGSPIWLLTMRPSAVADTEDANDVEVLRHPPIGRREELVSQVARNTEKGAHTERGRLKVRHRKRGFPSLTL